MKNLHFGILIAFLIIVLDQWSKHFIKSLLLIRDSGIIPLMPFLDIMMVWNQGITFGMFNDVALSKYIFVVVSLIIVGILFVWLMRSDNKLNAATLGMIIGGALGNVIDRFRFGAVFDFIGVYVNYDGRKLYWPIFNVADSFISIGAILLALYILLGEKEKGKKHP